MNPLATVTQDIKSAQALAKRRLAVIKKAKPILSVFDEVECTSCFVSPCGSADSDHIGTIFVYFRKVVKNMKLDTMEILELMDDLPGVDATWETNDNEVGDRVFLLSFWHNAIKYYLTLTAVVAEDGTCRKVVTGEKVETIRSPIYEIICPE